MALMENQWLLSKLDQLANEAGMLKQELIAMESIDLSRNPEIYEDISIKAALRSERIACDLRTLIFTTMNVRKEHYLLSAVGQLNVKVEESDGIINIIIPALIPRRKLRNIEFITDPLFFALKVFTEDSGMDRFKECVVCFSHIYEQGQPIRRVRDYDNIELRDVLNVICAFIMTDDSGYYCDVYNTTVIGERDCTKIAIMKKDRFLTWISEQTQNENQAETAYRNKKHTVQK